MDFLRPATWASALEAKAEHPQSRPIAGGTDVMVAVNFDQDRPPALLDLSGIADLEEWGRADGHIRVGASVTYSTIIDELSDHLPGLAIASRTVGSPQIRNRGTVGGNLGSASPAGDAHPPLLACDAVVEIASVRGTRQVPVTEFYTGVKRNVLQPDELIAAFIIEPATGPQQFSKVGPRNAMVIAVCSFALALHPQRRRIGTGIGSAAPTPRRAWDAERFLEDALEAQNAWETQDALDATVADRFGDLVAGAASPIDDVRGSASYRRHALSVMAKRALSWAWADFRGQ